MITSISVVIPLYNKRTTIRRSVESVLDQLCDNDELIIVDDGSTDGGPSVVDSCFSESMSIRLIRQKNMGVSAARNEGFGRARNKYVALLDADDWWLDGVRDKLEELINRWPCAQAWSVGHYRVDGKKRVYINSGLNSDSLLEGADFVYHYGKFSGTINSSTACIRRSTFFEIGGFPEDVTSGEDVYLWLRLGLQAEVAVSPAPLVCIERPLSGKPENKGRDVVGFHYRHFGDRRNLDRLGQKERAAVKGFLARNGLRQIAGSVAGGDRYAAWQKAMVIGSVVPWFPLLALAILAFPKRVLLWAFQRRHRMALSKSMWVTGSSG